MHVRSLRGLVMTVLVVLGLVLGLTPASTGAGVTTDQGNAQSDSVGMSGASGDSSTEGDDTAEDDSTTSTQDGEGEAATNADTGDTQTGSGADSSSTARVSTLSATSTDPVNPTAAGSGPKATVTSSWNAADDQVTSGNPVTFTVTYKNTTSTAITKARLWHQFMVEVAYGATLTVTCTSTGSASCPSDLHVPSDGISDGEAGRYYTTFWAVADLRANSSLTFTITVRTTLSAAVCADSAAVMIGGWARFSLKDFTVDASDPTFASASNAGEISSATECPAGAIRMTNTVASPLSSGNPTRVLSTDPRTFTVTWENTTQTDLGAVAVAYSYYVPYTGQVTEATWSCTASGGTGSCPAWANRSEATTINHDSAGEASDYVFGVSPDATDQTSATTLNFPAGQKYTFTITLATTINTCTQDGYLRVQTYARRGAGSEETDSFSKTAPSKLVEIGCSSWLLNEPFSGTSVADSAWKGLDQACLTAATSGTAVTNGLGYCKKRTHSPTTSFKQTGLPSGFLQLTDDSNDTGKGLAGAVLYDQALPSKNGLVLEFSTYQYGNDGTGADGIGFFLSNGSYSLTKAGDSGGALGYAYRESGTSKTDGLANAYLGVGLDVYGNFVNEKHTAPDCSSKKVSQTSQSVGLRGPGNGRKGYCLLAYKQVSANNSKLTLDKSNAGISNNNYDRSVATALKAAKRDVRVTVYPLKDGQTAPRVTVEINYKPDLAGSSYTTVIDYTMTDPAPELIKFGFLASTGGSKQAHLIGDVRVGTVLPLETLSVAKSVDHTTTSGHGTQKTTFDVGDKVPYQFVVTNSGTSPVYNLEIDDPKVRNVTCDKDTIPAGGTVTCYGTYDAVTESDRTNGYVYNSATARASTASNADAELNLSATDDETVPVNPDAPDATRTIQPGGTATFQLLNSGTTIGMVSPGDTSKITITPKVGDNVGTTDENGTTTITVSDQGTWTIDSTGKVTFTGNTGYTGDVTPLTYTATNAYGGSDTGTLRITISEKPTLVCTTAEQAASDRYWAFGTSALFDFDTSLSTKTIADVSSTAGTFTVTDSTGNLLFVVQGGTGAVGTASVVWANSTTAATSIPGAPTSSEGASPITVFPDGQGTGRFILVMSSATSTSAGQLSYWVIDTVKQTISKSGTLLGENSASTAVTSVPNADGTGYWVISADKTGTTIRSYPFTFATQSFGKVATSSVDEAAIDSGATSIPTSYEDIRFSQDFTQVATLASNSNKTVVRLMSFNAATGALTKKTTTASQSFTTGTGFSVDFSSDGTTLYASTISSDTTATAWSSTLGADFGAFSALGSSNGTGGALRRGTDDTIYWSSSGVYSLSGTTWTQVNLTEGTAATQGLSQTLSDCAISPSSFLVTKLQSDGKTAASGASFELLNADQEKTASTATVTAGTDTGTFTVTGVVPGSYYLRETTAPSGHTLLADDVLINVALRGEVTLDTTTNPQVKLLKTTDAAGITTYTIQVSDTKAVELPLTGGQYWGRIVAIAGAVLLGVALVGILWWRRTHRRALLPVDPRARARRGRGGGDH